VSHHSFVRCVFWGGGSSRRQFILGIYKKEQVPVSAEFPSCVLQEVVYEIGSLWVWVRFSARIPFDSSQQRKLTVICEYLDFFLYTSRRWLQVTLCHAAAAAAV
jgi:hypothetical protein